MSNNLFNVFEKQLGYKFMKPHKWHKEIKAWADGAEIEFKAIDGNEWLPAQCPKWHSDRKYRIKPQPKENEFSHIPYWLCCGSLDPHHHKRSCSEAKAGYPERCRFGTVEQHQKRMKQPKEPQYLYVYVKSNGEIIFAERQVDTVHKIIGKIKLEQDDE